MKKILLTLVALMPMIVGADNYQQIYMRTPKQLTVEQLVAGGAIVESTLNKYESLDKELEKELESTIEQAKKAHQENLQALANKPKPTAQQKQAMAEVQGDIMGALAAAGISMEQMANMSEEELMAILMPMVAQNTGLTEAEMRKLENMSDREAEAYLKAHPEMAARMQQSNYGQKGIVMKEGEMGAEVWSKADEKAVERIREIEDYFTNETLKSMNERTYEDALNDISNFKPTVDEEVYENRISIVYKELKQKLVASGIFNTRESVVKMPAWAKGYYDRINAVINEENINIARQYSNMYQHNLDKSKQEIDRYLALYNEVTTLYNSIESAQARSMVMSSLECRNLYGAISMYYLLEKLRIDRVPLVDEYTMPDVITEQDGLWPYEVGGKG